MGGVFGVFGHKEAAILTYLGLHALQHRGQETAGIVSSDSYDLYKEGGVGKVGDIFSQEKIEQLPGKSAIGHVGIFHQSTFLTDNIQPVKTEKELKGWLAACRDGKIVRTDSLCQELENLGAVFQSRSSDAEIVLHLIGRSRGNSFQEKLFNSLYRLKGAFSLLLLTESELIVARDPYGFRPLLLGKLDEAYIFSSESCAFDLIEAHYLREIKPGEVMVINEEGEHSFFPFKEREISLFPEDPIPHKFCVYEWIYFARPDSLVFGNKVAAKIRTNLGQILSKDEKVKADAVIPLPDSSNKVAESFAWHSGLRFHMDIIRSHYIDRSLTEPREKIKDFGTKIKFNIIPEVLKGERVILVAHSIILGKQISKIIKMVNSQTKETHLRVACPPIIATCKYGIDFPEENFIATRLKSEEKIAKKIGAASVRYLTIDGLYQAIGDPFYKDHCYACLTGEYPL